MTREPMVYCLFMCVLLMVLIDHGEMETFWQRVSMWFLELLAALSNAVAWNVVLNRTFQSRADQYVGYGLAGAMSVYIIYAAIVLVVRGMRR